MTMVFVDTWAWMALAFRRDQHHQAAKQQHAEFTAARTVYVTTDYVLSELITQLYRMLHAEHAEAFTAAIFSAIETGRYRLEYVTPERFLRSWHAKDVVRGFNVVCRDARTRHSQGLYW